MRVGMYYNNHDVRVEELPIPGIGPGELLMRVLASGICGTDVLEWYRIGHSPLVLGHEISGVVVSAGEGVNGYKKDDRIYASHHVPCNNCDYCLSGHHTVCDMMRRTNFDPGGFAEYVRLPAINVKYGVGLLPEEVSFEEATFIEPLACVIRGQRLAGFKPGNSVIIIGSGISGLLHIKLARAIGAGLIVATDINDYRLKAAKQFGADAVIYAEEDVPSNLRRINKGRLADLVIICTGSPSAILQALQSVERGGCVLFFAATQKGVTIPVSVNESFWRNEVSFTSSYGGSPSDCMSALELICNHKVTVSDMITHRLGLSDIGLGFRLVAEAKESIKVIIEPQKGGYNGLGDEKSLKPNN